MFVWQIRAKLLPGLKLLCVSLQGLSGSVTASSQITTVKTESG